jgi:hypothetical protein
VAVSEDQKGNKLSGTFRIYNTTELSEALPFDASAKSVEEAITVGQDSNTNAPNTPNTPNTPTTLPSLQPTSHHPRALRNSGTLE